MDPCEPHNPLTNEGDHSEMNHTTHRQMKQITVETHLAIVQLSTIGANHDARNMHYTQPVYANHSD